MLTKYLLAGLFAMALVFGIHQRGYVKGKEEIQAKWNAERQLLKEQQIEANNLTLRIEAEKAIKVGELLNEQSNRVESAMASASSARTELERLRNAIARLPTSGTSKNSAASCTTSDSGAVRKLLGNCSERYTQLASRTDALSTQIKGLHDWIAIACVSPTQNN